MIRYIFIVAIMWLVACPDMATATGKEGNIPSVAISYGTPQGLAFHYELDNNTPGYINYHLFVKDRLVNSGKLVYRQRLDEALRLVFSEARHAPATRPAVPPNASTTNQFDAVLREPVVLTILVSDGEFTRKLELAASRGVFQAEVLDHMPTLRDLLGKLSGDQPKMYRFDAFMDDESGRQVLPQSP